MTHATPSRLVAYLTLGYAALIVYASLYPLSGWHDSGSAPLAFLAAAWPRHYTGFDLASNVVAYLPFGFLLTSALYRHGAPWRAALLTVLGGALLSGLLELVQNYLPSRVPSNLDLACNSLGSLLGAVAGLRWGRFVADGSRLALLRERLLQPADGSDAGLSLLGVWLLTQLSPETLLFGSGNLRQLLALTPAQPFTADGFVTLEAMVAGSGLLAAGLAAGLLLRRHPRALVGALLAVALLVKTLAFALLMGPHAALHWLTPGNAVGLGAGLLLWWAASFLHPALQRMLAALALLFATTMVNIAPDNPYLVNTLQTWNPGQFLNFNGLTRLACALWPFLALAWLMLYRPRAD